MDICLFGHLRPNVNISGLAGGLRQWEIASDIHIYNGCYWLTPFSYYLYWIKLGNPLNFKCLWELSVVLTELIQFQNMSGWKNNFPQLRHVVLFTFQTYILWPFCVIGIYNHALKNNTLSFDVIEVTTYNMCRNYKYYFFLIDTTVRSLLFWIYTSKAQRDEEAINAFRRRSAIVTRDWWCFRK